jgi:signal transduction histidine kinase
MRWRSVQTRLLVIGLSVIVGVSLLMTVLGIRLTTAFLGVRFHENFTLLGSYMARNCELGVLLGDNAMLDRLARNVLEQEDIRVVRIQDANGKNLVSLAKAGSSGATVAVESPIMAAQISDDSVMFEEGGRQEKVGTVLLEYSRKGLDRLKKLMATRFMIISLVLSLGSALAYWLIARSIVAPLNDLVAVSREVSKGRMDVEARGGGLLETRTLAETFNEMLRSLGRHRRDLENAHRAIARQQALAEVGKFSMMVAHEVKNPLSIIKGSVEILRKQGLDPATRETMLAYLEEEVWRINRLIEDFLLFARPKEPEMVPVDMNRMVQEMVRRLELSAGASGVRLDLQLDEAPCRMACDPHLMERAMENIVRNALEVSKPGNRVIIRTALQDGCWVFKVTDQGTGILPKDLSSVFEPFFTTKAKGTGLGLSMAKNIVEAHKGSIGVENIPSGGARFEIRLPGNEAAA